MRILERRSSALSATQSCREQAALIGQQQGRITRISASAFRMSRRQNGTHSLLRAPKRRPLLSRAKWQSAFPANRLFNSDTVRGEWRHRGWQGAKAAHFGPDCRLRANAAGIYPGSLVRVSGNECAHARRSSDVLRSGVRADDDDELRGSVDLVVEPAEINRASIFVPCREIWMLSVLVAEVEDELHEEACQLNQLGARTTQAPDFK